jgi:lipoyl-dependent peroxiredoxin
MALARKSEAQWDGDLKQGKGRMKLGSGAYEGAYSFQSRFENGTGTNPEELIGAAHAGCFSMAFAAALGKEGYQPRTVHTVATVHLEKQGEGFAISRIDLKTEAAVSAIDAAKFQTIANTAKETCPVSKALNAVEITLDATLI